MDAGIKCRGSGRNLGEATASVPQNAIVLQELAWIPHLVETVGETRALEANEAIGLGRGLCSQSNYRSGNQSEGSKTPHQLLQGPRALRVPVPLRC